MLYLSHKIVKEKLDKVTSNVKCLTWLPCYYTAHSHKYVIIFKPH